ncbi:MAG: type VI secretion system secreted protein Hcp [Flavobacteriales bacterium]|jgi:type VI secretion system secreted protein Hcp
MAIYMNFNDKKPFGDVTALGYEQWIEIDNFNFGVARGISMQAGALGNRENSRPSITEINFSKSLDAASAGLFKGSVTGDEGVTVEIHIVQTGATQVEKFATFTMNDCIISSYSISASAGGPPSENVSISFSKIEGDLSYADKSNAISANMIVGYDLSTATSY